MANTLAQYGAQSATFVVPPVDGAFGYVGADVVDGVNADWDALPSGKLKDLLNTPYLSGTPAVPDFSLFFAAAAEAGFFSSSLTKNGSPAVSADSDIVQWSLGGEGFPKATVVTEDPVNEYQIRLVASYSASE